MGLGMIAVGGRGSGAVRKPRPVIAVVGCGRHFPATTGCGFTVDETGIISLSAIAPQFIQSAWLGILCGSGNSTSTSRRKAAACSGGTGLM